MQPPMQSIARRNQKLASLRGALSHASAEYDSIRSHSATVSIMGYTHYWHVRPETDAAKLDVARSEMQRVVETAIQSGYDLAGPTGEPDTELGEIQERWGFNGVGDDSYEAFLWPPDPSAGIDEEGYWFAFCKTNWRPYDAVVIPCLLVAKDQLGDEIRIGTDAESPEAWEPGEALYRKAFGREPSLAWPGDPEDDVESLMEDFENEPSGLWDVHCPACPQPVGRVPRKDEAAFWQSFLAHVEAVHPESMDDLDAWIREQHERRLAEIRALFERTNPAAGQE